MPYTPIGWKDHPSEDTPVSAANLNHMDNQIKENTEKLEEINPSDYASKAAVEQINNKIGSVPMGTTVEGQIIEIIEDLGNKAEGFTNNNAYPPVIGHLYFAEATTLKELFDYVVNNGNKRMCYIDRTNQTFRNSLVSLGLVDTNANGVGMLFSPLNSYAILIWYGVSTTDPHIFYNVFNENNVVVHKEVLLG